MITDSDPPDIQETEDSEKRRVYPAAGDDVALSDTASRLKKLENTLVKVHTGQRTFEYDLALEPANHNAMLAAFEELHPVKGRQVRAQVVAATKARDKAVAMFEGAFGARGGKATAKKGAFAQALADVLSAPDVPCSIPSYISKAILHACRMNSVPEENAVG